ncbi:hypothetical protein D049_2985B, partial [Vibrio parahaemolyticus VPTS-2010]
RYALKAYLRSNRVRHLQRYNLQQSKALRLGRKVHP